MNVSGHIKEAMDNLPSGICFFDSGGFIVLCNRIMYRLAFEISGKDPQFLSEMTEVLAQLPKDSKAVKDGDTFILEDGSAWKFSMDKIKDEDETEYIQVIAIDVTALYNGSKELADNIERLKETGEHIRQMKKDLAAITRENEILSMKMKIHDELGSSLLKLRKYHLGTDHGDRAELIANWRNTISMLRVRSRDDDGGDPMADLLRSAESIGVRIEIDGQLPEDKEEARLVTKAIRECLTNAVKHAGGTTIFVQIRNENGRTVAVITNDGRVPETKVIEGGGLSSLRRRIENAGGTMTVQSFPEFSLTITVPSMSG